jgi:hypothetical protein
MKSKKLIFIVLTIIAFINTYGQGVNKSIKITGIDLSQKIDNTHYLNSNRSICDTIFSFNTRPQPSGLAWDGQNLWYVDNSYIYKVSTTGMYIDSINNPASSGNFKGGDLTYDGLNLWYTDKQTAKLFKINPTNGDVLQQFNVPSFGQFDPNGFGLAWNGINIWHSQYSPPRLYKLNSINGNIIDSLTTTTGLLGLEWINGNLFGISGSQIFKINPNTGAFQDSTSWCIPFSLGLTWDGSFLWNVSGSESIGGITTGGKQKIYKLNPDLITSVSEYSKSNSDVEIFPNPATQSILIRGENIKTIEIYNVHGEKTYATSDFKQETSKEIDLYNFLKGIYFVKIYDGKKIYTEKIVKQ